MNRVLPTPGWIEVQYKDIFNEDDYNTPTINIQPPPPPKKVVIMLEGLCSNDAIHEDMVGSLKNVKFIYLKYETKINKFCAITSMPLYCRDGWTLFKDIQRRQNNKEVTCNSRLKEIISEILIYLYDYEEVVLVGFSHGCLILYSAIVKIRLLLEDSDDKSLLNKLSFYAVTPPYPLQNILLFRKYKNEIIPSQRSDLCRTNKKEYMKESPFFLQLHCEKDEFFTPNTFFIDVVFSIVVGKMRKKFAQWFKEIKTTKDEIFMVNENENVAMLLSKPESFLPSNVDTFKTKMIENCYSNNANDLNRLFVLFEHSTNNLHASRILMQIITNTPYFLYNDDNYKNLLTDKNRALIYVLDNFRKNINTIYADYFQHWYKFYEFKDKIAELLLIVDNTEFASQLLQIVIKFHAQMTYQEDTAKIKEDIIFILQIIKFNIPHPQIFDVQKDDASLSKMIKVCLGIFLFKTNYSKSIIDCASLMLESANQTKNTIGGDRRKGHYSITSDTIIWPTKKTKGFKSKERRIWVNNKCFYVKVKENVNNSTIYKFIKIKNCP